MKKIKEKSPKNPENGTYKNRILKICVKTLLIRLPLVLVALILLAGLFLPLYINEKRLENILVEQFAEMSYGTLELNVKQSNIYSGFVLENITIRSSKEFNNSPLCTIDKIIISYDFFALFTGTVRIPEIGIYNPTLYLKQKNGKWNISGLMKPATEEKEPEPEKPSTDEISLPVSVECYLSFILQNLSVYIDGETLNGHIKGLSYNAAIEIPPFRTIKKSPAALTLIKTLEMKLNEKEQLDVALSSRQATIDPPLIFTWKLVKQQNGKNDPAFITTFKCGTGNRPVRLKDRISIPLHFFLSYDIHYYPASDKAIINNATLVYNKKKWFDITGSVSKINKEMYCNIRTREGTIYLKELLPLYRLATNDYSTRFAGTIAVHPLSLKGPAANPSLQGTVSLQKVLFVKQGNGVQIPRSTIDYSVHYSRSNTRITSSMTIPYFNYFLNGKRSGENAVSLSLDMNGRNNFKAVLLNNFNIKLYNPVTKGVALDTTLAGRVETGRELKGSVTMTNFRFKKAPLANMVTRDLKQQINRIPLEKPLDMKSQISLSLDNNVTRVRNTTTISIPDYNIPDLKLESDAYYDQKQQIVRIGHFSFGSKKLNLSLNIKGFLQTKQKPFSDSDMHLSLLFQNPDKKRIYGDWEAAGTVNIQASLKGGMKNGRTKGNITIKDLYASNKKRFFDIKDLDLKFPFDYILQTKTDYLSILDISKQDLINNNQFSEQDNLHLAELQIKHLTRQEPVKIIKDLTGNMAFKNNIFQILNLKGYILGGSLYGRNIMFNLADLKTRNMEYKIITDCTNISISRYNNPKKIDLKSGDELSFNINVAGKGINFKKNINTNGNINIHKIGRKFAEKLFRALNKKKGENMFGGITQNAVNSAAAPKQFKFLLDSDLMYATVYMYDRTILSIENDVLEYPRKPVREYINELLKE